MALHWRILQQELPRPARHLLKAPRGLGPPPRTGGSGVRDAETERRAPRFPPLPPSTSRQHLFGSADRRDRRREEPSEPPASSSRLLFLSHNVGRLHLPVRHRRLSATTKKDPTTSKRLPPGSPLGLLLQSTRTLFSLLGAREVTVGGSRRNVVKSSQLLLFLLSSPPGPSETLTSFSSGHQWKQHKHVFHSHGSDRRTADAPPQCGND